MRSALTQTTTYAVMDYFDQFTFAQTTAQMIAEIGYTEIMTITSTLISAPFVVLGSYAAKATNEASKAVSQSVVKIGLQESSKLTFKQAFKQSLSSLVMKGLVYEMAKRVVVGTIKETIEEIVVDGFFETAIQSAVRMAGGTADAGHWLSTLFTSVRETANFGFLTGGTDSDIQSQTGFRAQVYRAMESSTEFESVVALVMALSDKTSSKFIADNEKLLTELMKENDVLESSRTEAKITWAQAIGAGLFTGLSLLVPSLAGFNIYALGRIFGNLGGKFEAKLNNKFLASRNSKMLGNDAQEIEKQDTPQKSKTVDPSNLPKAPIILTTPIATSPIETRPSVEAMIRVAGGHVIMTPLDTSGTLFYKDSYDDPGATFIKDEKQKVEKNQEKLEDLKNLKEENSKDIRQQQEEAKQKIFENVELSGFDPYDSNLKYPLTERDNLQSILFKTLLNLIYKNKKTIESVYSEDTRFDPTEDGTLNYKTGSNKDLIHPDNLGVILGLTGRTIRTDWLSQLDSQGQDFTFGREHQRNIRVIRDSLNSIFDHIRLKEAKVITSSLIENYIRLRYIEGDYFVMRLLTYIDDYTDFGILSERRISEDKFKMSHSYLQDFRDKDTDYKKFSKYFNLITNIYISGQFDFGITDLSKFNDFKLKIVQLVYMTLVEEGSIKESRLGGLKFYSICLTLQALSALRLQSPAKISQDILEQNPHGFYTLNELSTIVSPHEYRQLLSNQLRDGSPSFQLGNIFDELQVGIDKNIEECSIAKDAITRYLSIEQVSTSRIGKIMHHLYEQVVIQYLRSKGVRCAHEKLVNFPRGFKPDNIIEINDAFRKIVEANQNILSIPDLIKLITVDYTFSSDPYYIFEKLDKHYQSEDRLLIIVLLGQKNDRDIANINEMLQEAIDGDDGSKHLENVRIMTSEEYKEFLGFDGNHEKTFDRYQKYSFGILHSNSKLYEILRQSRRAEDNLKDLKEDWIETYLHQG